MHTIQEALALVSRPQLVRAGQSNSSEASQQVQIEVLPPVLVLHLERFLYDVTTDGIMKINKPIQFGPELEIPPGTIFPFLPGNPGLRIPHRSVYLEIMAPVTGKSGEGVHYKLYGVLYHHGESAGSGHYTVDVIHPRGESGVEGWLHIDDEIVKELRHEDVFGGKDDERVDKQCAYMLFYCRTAPT